MAGCGDNLLLLDNRIAYRAVSTFAQTRCSAGGFDGDIFDFGVTLGLNDRRSADSFAALRANLVFHAVHRAARRYGHGLRSVLMHIVIAVAEFKTYSKHLERIAYFKICRIFFSTNDFFIIVLQCFQKVTFKNQIRE